MAHDKKDITNPFLNEKGSIDQHKLISHLKKRWPALCDAQNRELFKYNGRFYESVHISQLNRVIRNIIGDEVHSKSLEFIINSYKDSVITTSINEQSERRYLNLENGIYDLRERKLRPHSPDHIFFNNMPVKYLPNAKCPNWIKILKEVFEDDQKIINLVAQIFGYTLLPHCNYQKYFIFFGEGANGKSTLSNILKELLGHHNVANLSMSEVGERFNLIALKNKYANISEETPTSRPIHMDIIKRISDGGVFSTDVKYGSRESFQLNTKLIFCSNVIPTFEHTHGAQRRLVLIPFKRIFKESEMDRSLPLKLKDELSGILNWSLEGMAMLESKQGFEIPTEIISASDEFHNSFNSVAHFVDEFCNLDPEASIESNTLYQIFSQFCLREGYSRQTHTTFGKKLISHTDRKVTNERSSTVTDGIRKRKYRGLKLREGWQSELTSSGLHNTYASRPSFMNLH